MILSLAFLAAFAAAAPDEPLTEPLSELPPTWPLPSSSREGADVPPPEAPPSPPLPGEKPEAAAPQGLHPFWVGTLQTGVACGAACGTNCVLATGCVLCASGALPALPVATCIAAPLVAGTAATALGDHLGQERAAVVWPVVAALGVASVGTAIHFGYELSKLATPYGLGFDPWVVVKQVLVGDFNGAVSTVAPIVVVPVAVQLGILVASAAAVPITYAIVAEPKRAGDHGQGFPGLFEPAHPEVPPPSASGAPDGWSMSY
jgi:hypothetical protein